MIEILIYAAIAGYFFFRYKDVLGQRPDIEKKNKSKDDSFTKHDNVVLLSPRPELQPARPKRHDLPPEDAFPASLAGNLARMQYIDPAFNEKAFLQGAREAFRMIVSAYAEGDKATLKGLLDKKVYTKFAAVIDERKQKGESMTFSLEQIRSVDIINVQLKKSIADISVEIVSEQMEVTRDKEGNIIEGDPNHLEEIHDIWTFQRDLLAPDPNWLLVSTKAE